MKITLRLEEENDYETVENITREAFWNLHVPGCDEHLLVHNLRKTKEFVHELDFVAVSGEKIVGNIMYAQAKVIDCEKEHAVLTFGPVSVLPEYQNKGIGAKLINHTVQSAKKMGYKAILIYGFCEYYEKFGFKPSKEYNIADKEKKFPAALLALELFDGALTGIKGVFDEGKAYEIDPKKAESFDKKFSPKEKFKTKTQDIFKEISGKYL
ncbi:MAG: N-acetyltransferase [Chitinivibrionia bacterium]|nr:N-acetyltransferase [Chitinivibrionia bacterium]